jgi:hypothetical protein
LKSSAESPISVLDHPENRGTALLHKPTGRGQRTSAAIEQSFAELTLQSADPLTHRRLPSVLCSCSGEAAFHGDREEDFQSPEVHGRETLPCCVAKLNALFMSIIEIYRPRGSIRQRACA